MEINRKIYHLSKTKNYLKYVSFYLFCGGTNKNSNQLLSIEQNLKNHNHIYYKLLTTLAKKLIENSVYSAAKQLLNGNTFFLSLTTEVKRMTKDTLKKKVVNTPFILLSIKFNNKLYSSYNLNQINSFNYKENKLFLHQFKTTNLKMSKITSK